MMSKDERATVAAEHGRTSLTVRPAHTRRSHLLSLRSLRLLRLLWLLSPAPTPPVTHARALKTVRGFTPMYMAPELLQHTGSRCSEASDVYAAGLMFYDMLKGAAHRRQPPPSVPSLDTLEPAERDLLQQWLHQNPQRLLRSSWKPKWPCSRKCNGERPSCRARLVSAVFAGTTSTRRTGRIAQGDGPAAQGRRKGLVPAAPARLRSEAQIEAVRKVQEQKLSQDLEARYKQQLKEEMERYERLSAEQRQMQQARVYIQEDLLTLKCPRPNCRRAFLDFNGCFALTCGACGCGFCAWCLQDCGQDAHAHVVRCNANAAPRRDVYFTLARFEQAQRARRERWVREYLRTLGSQERKVLDAVRPSLLQLGLQQLARGPLRDWGCSSWQEAPCAKNRGRPEDPVDTAGVIRYLHLCYGSLESSCPSDQHSHVIRKLVSRAFNTICHLIPLVPSFATRGSQTVAVSVLANQLEQATRCIFLLVLPSSSSKASGAGYSNSALCCLDPVTVPYNRALPVN
eukprot:g19541.t1